MRRLTTRDVLAIGKFGTIPKRRQSRPFRASPLLLVSYGERFGRTQPLNKLTTRCKLVELLNVGLAFTSVSFTEVRVRVKVRFRHSFTTVRVRVHYQIAWVRCACTPLSNCLGTLCVYPTSVKG